MPVRLARLEEAQLLPAIERSSDQVYRADPQLAWVADSAPIGAEHYSPLVEAGTVWVAGDNTTPVAFVAVGAHEDGAVIYQLSTAVEHQRRGHGTALLLAAIDWARRQGHPRVMLTTNRGVAWNEPYYRRFGFVEASPPTASLAHMLAHEADRGHDPARRVGMVLTLTGDEPADGVR